MIRRFTGLNRVVIVSCFLLASTGTAGEVKIWRQATEKDFHEGSLTRTVVDSNATVSLSRQIDPFADLDVEIVWSIAKSADGKAFYVATGNPGSVLRVDNAGKIEPLHHAENQQFFAVTVDAKGTVYAGESPSGKIYSYPGQQSDQTKAELDKLATEEKELVGKFGPKHPKVTAIRESIEQLKRDGRREFFATGESYVWALTVDPEGNVYAATGPNGKVFRIAPDGKGEIVLQAKQPHILSLALAPSGVFYAGTSKDGLVYKHTPPDKNYVLLDADQSDIQTLLLTADGTLFAGTGSPSRPKLPNTTLQGKSSDGVGADLTAPTRGLEMQSEDSAATKTAVDASALRSADAAAGGTAVGSSRSAGPAAAGENSVYQIATDGIVKEIFREKVIVLSLARQADHLLIGTGQEGRLYAVDLTTHIQGELARLEHGQISQLVADDSGKVCLAASTPGELYMLDDGYAKSGTFLSSVLDAKLQTRWGSSQWRVAEPEGTTLEVAVRAGNTSEPDDTWSEWMAESSKLPLSRFLQYQVKFNSPNGSATPSLSDFVLYYATVNQAPIVESIEVPQLATSPVANAAEKIKVKWKATDPNSDQLSYVVEVKKEDWPDWIKISEEKLTKTEIDWDPASMPSGSYLVRVLATDRAHNRQEETMTASKVSEAFLVDRDPPVVKIDSTKGAKQQFQVRVVGRDELTRLTAASYSIDGKEWQPLLPDDGLFDAREEPITFSTDELSSGPHVLMIRFQDSAGHYGVADTVLNVP